MAGGGGGPYTGGGTNPRDLAQQVRDSAQRLTDERYHRESAKLINSLLVAANNRDHDEIRDELDSALKALHGEVAGSLRVQFGGSVAKHTYVDGISDVDALVLLNNTDLESKTPEEVREYFATQLKKRFPDAEIKIGNLCVTLQFEHRQIQLLPAIKTSAGFRISNEPGDSWANIRPKEFTDQLSAVNNQRAHLVVPTIKLAKSIMADLPENRRLSGYHVEALAVEIFKDYKGYTNKKGMLMHFFQEASKRILAPTQDVTGQTTHIDEHLGKAGSLPRQLIADSLGRIHRRMQNAEAFGQAAEWESLFQAQLIRQRE